MKQFVEPEIEILSFEVKDQVANRDFSEDLGEWD